LGEAFTRKGKRLSKPEDLNGELPGGCFSTRGNCTDVKAKRGPKG